MQSQMPLGVNNRKGSNSVFSWRTGNHNIYVGKLTENVIIL
jgi:hypothetical protein